MPERPNRVNEIWNVREVADYLRCHQSTVYRLLYKGGLPAFKLGSDWRFTRAAIDKWVADQYRRVGTRKYQARHSQTSAQR